MAFCVNCTGQLCLGPRDRDPVSVSDVSHGKWGGPQHGRLQGEAAWPPGALPRAPPSVCTSRVEGDRWEHPAPFDHHVASPRDLRHCRVHSACCTSAVGVWREGASGLDRGAGYAGAGLLGALRLKLQT